MSRSRKKRIPSYRHLKAKNLAFVEFDGHRHYLGRFDSSESRERYHTLFAEWESNGQRLSVAPHECTVVELCARFLSHAETYYRKPSGEQTTQVGNYTDAVRLLKRLYGRCKVSEFSVVALKAIRVDLIASGLARTTINQRIGLIGGFFNERKLSLDL